MMVREYPASVLVRTDDYFKRRPLEIACDLGSVPLDLVRALIDDHGECFGSDDPPDRDNQPIIRLLRNSKATPFHWTSFSSSFNNIIVHYLQLHKTSQPYFT